MANIILRDTNKWITKPPSGSQINWGHPLSRGLVGCWLLNEGGGLKVKNIANRDSGIATAISWGNSSKGKCLDFPYVDNNTNYIRSILGSFPEFTVLMSAFFPPTASDGGITSYVSRFDGNGGWRFGIYVGGGYNPIYVGISNFNAGAIDQAGVTNLAGSKKWYQIGCTQSSTNLKLYLDGKIDLSAVPAKIPTTNATNFDIHWDYFNLIGDTKIAYVYYWNRILSPSEIQQLYQEPYGFINPIRRRIFYPIPSATSDIIITPNVLTAIAQLLAPTVSTGINITITPDVLMSIAQVIAPSIIGNALISPSVLSATMILQSISVSGNANITASVIDGHIVINAPTILTDQLIQPAVLIARALINNPTILTAMPAGIVDIILKNSMFTVKIDGLSEMALLQLKKAVMTQRVNLQSKIRYN